MDAFTTTISAAVIPFSAIVGGKLGGFLASAGPLPPWIAELLGPFGVLIGMFIAITWLVNRLNKQELRAEKRDEKREIDIAALATMASHNQTIIEQNSAMLRDSTEALEKCRQCEVKYLIQQKQNQP